MTAEPRSRWRGRYVAWQDRHMWWPILVLAVTGGAFFALVDGPHPWPKALGAGLFMTVVYGGVAWWEHRRDERDATG